MNDAKTRLRKKMRKRLKRMTAQERKDASAEICSRILAMNAVHTAEVIAMYSAMKSEPDLSRAAEALLEGPFSLVFPRFDRTIDRYELAPVRNLNDDFTVGAYGVFEPQQNLPALDADAVRKLVWFVPGLAFDRGGNRLGRGGGHYDRLLEEMKNVCIGVAFDSQLVEAVPAQEHDVQMDFVVTEAGVYECREESRSNMKGSMTHA